MKKFVAAFVAVVFSFTLFFAVPFTVQADDDLQWLDDFLGYGGDSSWFAWLSDWAWEYANDPSSPLSQWQAKTFAELDGTATKQYYTGSGAGRSFAGTTDGTGGGGGGLPFTVTAYESGQTVATAPTSYSSTTNTYSFYQPTTTNNNYYNRYDISNVYYNQQYNTYMYETTNNYNYYVTYSPTYYNITYLDSGSGSVKSDVYYYKLPDGRNSFDLKAADVYGQYFIYDVGNYDTVIEAPGVEGLWHLDGDLSDSGPAGHDAYFTSGASQSYVDSGAFNQALYNSSSSSLLVFPSSGSTVEWRSYLSAISTSIPASNYAFNTNSFDVPGLIDPSVAGSPELPRNVYAGTILDSVSVTKGWTRDTSSSLVKWTSQLKITMYSNYGTLFAFNGVPLVGLVAYSTGYVDQTCWQSSSGTIATYLSQTYTQISQTVSFATSTALFTPQVGTWTSFAYSGGDLYMNGLKVAKGTLNLPLDNAGNIAGFVARHRGPYYNNFWYLDEVRISTDNRYTAAYTPAAAPYDTSKVLVLPDTGQQGSVAIKSSVPVTAFRVGGVRPSAPVQGNVYISLDSSHKVTSAQQYNNGNWGSVDGAIYDTGQWVTLSWYSMRSYTIEDSDPGGSNSDSNSGGSSSSGGGSGGSSFDWAAFLQWLKDNFGGGGSASSSGSDGGGGTGGGDDDGGGIGDFFGWLWSGITSFFTWVFGGLQIIVDWLVSALAGLAAGLGTAFGSVLDIVGGFIGFLAAIFVFLPEEIVSVFVIGIVVMVILAIIKHFRGD